MSSSTAWSRSIRFIALEDGQEHYGQPTEDVDVGLAYHNGERITARILSASPLSPNATVTSRILTVKRLLPPVPATDIRGLGLQYFVSPKPDVPVLFFKPQSALAGPGDEIFIPRIAAGEKVDYEVELCVVIGKDCKNVSEEEALNYVAGYTVANDLTSRGLSVKGIQWGMGKAFDSWCPIGPVLVSPASLSKDIHDLEITTTVNGQTVQAGSTKDLVYKLPEIISRLSHGSTLSAGSIILTGSPMAVGRKAPGDLVDDSPFLKHCDVVKCFVEGIGTLVNTVREEGATSSLGHVKAKL